MSSTNRHRASSAAARVVILCLTMASTAPVFAEDLPLNINVGVTPNDGTGDTLRTTALKTMRSVNALNALRGVPNGMATLDASGRLPAGQLPSPIRVDSSVVTADGAGVPRPLPAWFADRANVLAFPGSDLSAKFSAACASPDHS